MGHDRFGATFLKMLNLALGYQLLAHRLYEKFLRFYGVLLGLAIVLLAGSVWMLANIVPGRPTFGPFWLWCAICVATMLASYLIERTVGALPLALVSIILPATLIISPAVMGTTGHVDFDDASDESTSGLVTGDFHFFMKGALVFGVLVGIASGSYVGCESWQQWRHWKRRPPRHPAAAALLIAGLAALELLRITTHCTTGVQPFWEHALGHYMREPGWPYALCLWLWVEIGGIWGLYESRVLPYLLHRVGHNWVPRRLALQDAYLVDQLIAALSPPPVKPADHHGHRGRKGH